MADILLTIAGNTAELDKAINQVLSKPRSAKGITSNTFTEPLGRITGKSSEFQKSLEASNARVLAFGASAGAIFAIQKAFSVLVTSTIEVEKSINGIGTILGVSSGTLKAFSNELFAVASQTGTSFKNATGAAQEFARQGLSVSETLQRTRDALILARISGMDFADSARSITTAINAFGKEMLTSTEIINRLSAADTSFAVSAKDLADALSRVGSAAEDSNVSFNQTIALVTSAAQITGRSGSVIGNAFKSMFTRLERPKVLADLESIGVATRNANGGILPMMSILKNLASSYDTLAPGQKSFISETVGGIYQINTLKAVLSDLGSGFSVYDAALKTVNNSTDSAINRNEQLNQTISAKLNTTLNNLTQVAAKVGNLTIAPMMKSGGDFGSSLLKSASEGVDSEGMGGQLARGFLKGIGSVIGGPGLQFITFAILKLFQNLTIFAAKAVRDFSGLNTKGKELELTQVQVLQKLAQQPAILDAIRNKTLTVNQAAKSVFAEIQAENTALNAQLSIMTLISQVGMKAGFSVQGTKYRTKVASGYVPNFNSDFAMEEAQAKSLGAINPRAHLGKGTIGGKPFVMNNKETEIPNFGVNGDSAVIPNYSKGFVPNFAKNENEIKEGINFERKLNKKFFYQDSNDPNGVLDFPFPSLASVSGYTRKLLGMDKDILYGDAKRTNDKANNKSLLDKYLRTRDGSSEFLSARINERGFIDLKPSSRGFGMLYLKESDGGAIAHLSTTRNASTVSASSRNLIHKKLSRTDNPNLNRTISMTYLPNKIREENLPILSGEATNSKRGSLHSSGHIPNFSHYFYDADMVPGKERAGLMQAILARSGVKKNVWLAPAGTGKTTLARKQIGKSVTSLAQLQAIQDLSEITMLSASGISSKGGITAPLASLIKSANESGGEKKYLLARNKDIINRRNKRVEEGSVTGDLRDVDALSRTHYAKLNDPTFIKILRGEGFNYEHLSRGHVPSFSPAYLKGVTPESTESGFASIKSKSTMANTLRMIARFNGVDENVLEKSTPEVIRHIVKTNPELFRKLVSSKAIRYGQKMSAGFLPNFVDSRSRADKLQSMISPTSGAMPGERAAAEAALSRITSKKTAFSGTNPQELIAELTKHAGRPLNQDTVDYVNYEYKKGRLPAFVRGLNNAPGFVNGVLGFAKGNLPAPKQDFSQIVTEKVMPTNPIVWVDKDGTHQTGGNAFPGFDALALVRIPPDGRRRIMPFSIKTGTVSTKESTFNATIPKGLKTIFGQPDVMRQISKGLGVNASRIPFADAGQITDERGGINETTLLESKSKSPRMDRLGPRIGYSRTMDLYHSIDDPRIGEGNFTYQNAYEEAAIKKLGEPDVINKLANQPQYGGDSFESMFPDPSKTKKAKRARGFVPSFSAVKQAIAREMDAGYSESQIRIGRDGSLRTPSNPDGLGVFNSTEGSLTNGINLAKKAGINPKTKGKAAGHVPNFSDPMASMGLGFTQFLLQLPLVTAGFARMVGPSKDVIDKLAKLSDAIGRTTKQKDAVDRAVISGEARVTASQAQKTAATTALASINANLNASPHQRAKAQSDFNLASTRLTTDEATVTRAKGAQTTISARLANERAEEKKLNQPTFGERLISEKGYGEGKLGKGLARFQNAGMGISVAGSLAGGVAGEMASKSLGADKGAAVAQFGESIGMAGQVMATLPGPLGMVAAGSTLLWGGMKFAEKWAWGFAEKLKAASDIKLQGIDRINGASNALSQTMNAYQNILSNSSSLSEETNRAYKKYKTALSDFAASGVDAKTLQKVTGAGSMKERQAALSQAGDERGREAEKENIKKNAVDLAEKMDIQRRSSAKREEYAGMFGLKSVVGLFDQRDPQGSIFDKKNEKSGGGIGLLKSLTKGALESTDSSGESNSAEYIKEMAKELNLKDEDTAALARHVNITRKSIEAEEALGTVIVNKLKKQRAERDSIENYVQSLKMVQTALKSFRGDMFVKHMGTTGERIGSAGKARNMDFEIESAKAMSLTRGGALSAGGIIQTADDRALEESRLSMAKIKNEGDKSSAEVQSTFIKGITDELKATLAGTEGTDLTKENKGTTKGYERSAEYMAYAVKNVSGSKAFQKGGPEAVDILRSQIYKSAGIASKRGETEVAQRLNTAAANLSSSKVQELILQRSQSLQEKSVEQLQKIGLTLIEQKDNIQKMVNQRVLASGGGTAAFTQDFGMDYRRNLRRNMSEMQSGIPEVSGRGALEFAKKAKNDLNMFGRGSPQYEAARQQAIKGVEASLTKTNDVYQRMGYGGSTQQEIKEKAASQVEEAMGGQSTEELLKEQTRLETDGNKILEEIRDRTGIQTDLKSLTSGTGIQQFQNKANVAMDNQMSNSMVRAAYDLKFVSTNLNLATANLEKIKVDITNQINVITTESAEGKTATKRSNVATSHLRTATNSGPVKAPETSIFGFLANKEKEAAEWVKPR